MRLSAHKLAKSPFWHTRLSCRWAAVHLFPVGALAGLDIALTNYAFAHSSIALTEIIKALIPIMIYIFSVCRGSQRVTAPKLGSVAVLCAGVALASLGEFEAALNDEETHSTARGMAAAVGAMVCGAAKMVM